MKADYLAATDVTAVILAGGKARRMGGNDKGLVELAGQPMVVHIVSALRPQVAQLIINANRNLSEYQRLGQCQVVSDSIAEFAGPLAGMARALACAQTEFVLTVPCDSPLIEPDLAQRQLQTLLAAQAPLSVAHDGERLQPVFALLRRSLLPSLSVYLQQGHRKIDDWYAQHHYVTCDFSDSPDMFSNVNTPEQRDQLEEVLRHRP